MAKQVSGFNQTNHDAMCFEMDRLFGEVGIDMATGPNPAKDEVVGDVPPRDESDKSRKQAAEYFGKSLFPRLST